MDSPNGKSTRSRDDPDVKAVVVRVDSPGGTVTGSDYLYHHLRKLREDRSIPLVVSMGGIAASGGYYISMAAGSDPDTIFAERTTWTGSIGVIIPHFTIADLLESWKIKDDSITSGPYKDLGSPTRKLSPVMAEEERKILQTMVDQTFDTFKDVVTDARPQLAADKDKFAKATTGQVFTAKQALDLGLVDKLGFHGRRRRSRDRTGKPRPRKRASREVHTARGAVGTPCFGPTTIVKESSQSPPPCSTLPPRAYYLYTLLPAAGDYQFKSSPRRNQSGASTYFAPFSGTFSRISSSTWSVSISSACASKFTITRCRSAGKIHAPHILEAHVVAPVQQRPHLGRQRDRLRRPRAGAPAQILLGDRQRELPLRMRGQREPHDVILHVLGQNHFAHKLLPAQNFRPVHNFFRLDRLRPAWCDR